MASDVGFETALKELEQTVGTLEGGDLGLEVALTAYEQGVGLLRYCYGLLDGAERTVAILKDMGPFGDLEFSPFPGTAGASAARDADPSSRAEGGADGALDEEDDTPSD